MTCTGELCTPTEVADSDMSSAGSITGRTSDTHQVTCSPGFTGGGTVTCAADNTFNVVTCTANSCTATEVDNSNYATIGSISGTTGDTHTVTCNTGYNGGGTLTCGTDGNFDTHTCAANSCTATEVANSLSYTTIGSITGYTGDTVTVSCSPGYSGSGTVTCQTSGIFTTVTCEPEPCTATQVFNSDFAALGSITGSTSDVVVVTCDAGYSGGGNAKCQDDNTFISLTCTANSCTATEVANSPYSAVGSITGTTGQTVDIVCDSSYGGDGTTTCGTDGLFTTITCAIGGCTATEVAKSDYAVISSLTGVEGETHDVTCDIGYEGGGTVTCTSGLFNVVTCTAGSCAATQVANSDYATSGSITGITESSLSVTCDVGYSGGGTVTCAADGNFNVVTCAPSACTTTQVANSDHATSGSIAGTTGDVMEVSCDTGYSGGGTVTCATSGSFNTVLCVPEDDAQLVVDGDSQSAALLASTTSWLVPVVCGIVGLGLAYLWYRRRSNKKVAPKIDSKGGSKKGKGKKGSTGGSTTIKIKQTKNTGQKGEPPTSARVITSIKIEALPRN